MYILQAHPLCNILNGYLIMITTHTRIWRTLLKKLQTQPHKILRRNIDIDRFIKHAKTDNHLQRILQRYTYSDPIFLLLECFGSSCPLNRLYYPERRKRLVQKLYTLHLSQHVALEYISWGSSALLQDVIFLAHLIPLVQPLHLAIHLIDPIFDCFNQDQSNITHAERCLQFERWLKNTFPEISANITYHKDVLSYHAIHKKTDNQLCIGLAVDVDRTHEDLHILTHNPLSIWFILTADNPHHVLHCAQSILN